MNKDNIWPERIEDVTHADQNCARDVTQILTWAHNAKVECCLKIK